MTRTRRVLRFTVRATGILLLLLALFALVLAINGWNAFGQLPAGDRLARLATSPQWQNGAFANQRKAWIDRQAAYRDLLTGDAVSEPEANAPVPVVRPDPATLARLPASGLRVTWFGHSSTLVEIDGTRILVDPMWGNRASPVGWLGPARWFAPPIALGDLPPIDAVVISHDHYDHLDRDTILALAPKGTLFIVPPGIGSHLAYWGVAERQIVELDWWDQRRIGDLTVTATPARHASGRLGSQSNHTLWAGYALVGPAHRVWYSGDTGFLPEFAEIGRRLGPFDATLLDTGQYDPAWPDNHLGPELAVEAHRLVGGKTLIPIHWALFNLAPHAWTEPPERILAAARCAGVKLAMPRPGESIDPATAPPPTRWWPELAWRTAAQKPQLATLDGNPAHRVAIAPCTLPTKAPE
jgi:L-ascorbate metabolism protein UlaG (beta-lactamase superfamily)